MNVRVRPPIALAGAGGGVAGTSEMRKFGGTYPRDVLSNFRISENVQRRTESPHRPKRQHDEAGTLDFMPTWTWRLFSIAALSLMACAKTSTSPPPEAPEDPEERRRRIEQIERDVEEASASANERSSDAAASNTAEPTAPAPSSPASVSSTQSGGASAQVASTATPGGASFTGKGKIPREVIQRVVRANFGRFRFCYEQGLTKDPALKGRVVVAFTIAADGRVSAASGGGTMPDKDVTSCVAKAFSRLQFPAVDGAPVKVAYPIEFAPG